MSLHNRQKQAFICLFSLYSWLITVITQRTCLSGQEEKKHDAVPVVQHMKSKHGGKTPVEMIRFNRPQQEFAQPETSHVKITWGGKKQSRYCHY